MDIIGNSVTVSGEIISHFSLNHEIFGESFYDVKIKSTRLSGSVDIIPILVSERLLDVSQNYIGMAVRVNGQFRSNNNHEERKAKHVLSVFDQEIEFLGETDERFLENKIYLEGYICKEPIYRKTPLGREIADLLLAVNRPYGKSDYIPYICWGRNARYASGFVIGCRVSIEGRIQSRQYIKKLDDEMEEARIAYEVSVSIINLLDE